MSSSPAIVNTSETTNVDNNIENNQAIDNPGIQTKTI